MFLEARIRGAAASWNGNYAQADRSRLISALSFSFGARYLLRNCASVASSLIDPKLFAKFEIKDSARELIHCIGNTTIADLRRGLIDAAKHVLDLYRARNAAHISRGKVHVRRWLDA